MEDLEPWPEAVDGAQLLNELASTFTRYVALPEWCAETLALWVLHAWTLPAAYHSPLLILHSPEKRCGKTLTLGILRLLVPRALVASNITPAALFRSVDKWCPTLIIDEADTFVKENDELRGIINSGHTRDTAYVIRTVGEDQ